MFLSTYGLFRAVGSHERSPHVTFDVDPTSYSSFPKFLFKTPCIAEVLGSGFERPQNTNILMLRHPRITKIHGDRGYEDVVSMDELQEHGRVARSLPSDVQEEERNCLSLIQKVSKPKRREYVTQSSPFSERQTESAPSRISPIFRNPRRSHELAPMVRMDSFEMRPGEERFATPFPGPANDCPAPVDVRRTNLRDESSKRRSSDSCLSLPPTKRAKTQMQPAPNESNHVPKTSTKAAGSPSPFLSHSKSPLKALSNNTAHLHNQRKTPEAREPLPPIALVTIDESPDTVLPSVTSAAMAAPRDILMADDSAEGLASSFDPGMFLTPVRETAPNTLNAGSSSQQSEHSSLAPIDAIVANSKVPKSLEGRTSPFEQHVFYLPPSLSNILYLKNQLLGLFRLPNVTSDLEHWMRKVHLPEDLPGVTYDPATAPLAFVVPESPSFRGSQKAVLVETRLEAQQLKAEIREVVGCVRLVAGEIIEVWNWRLLEQLAELEWDQQNQDPQQSQSTVEAVFKRNLLGRIRHARRGTDGAEDERGVKDTGNVFEPLVSYFGHNKPWVDAVLLRLEAKWLAEESEFALEIE